MRASGLIIVLILIAGCDAPREEAARAPEAEVVVAPAAPTQPQVTEAPPLTLSQRRQGLTFSQRKAQGLLTPEELGIVEELAKMREENEEYNRKREARLAKQAAAAEAAHKQRLAAVRPTTQARRGRPRSDGYQIDVDELGIYYDRLKRQERDKIRKWRYQHGLPTQNPTRWEKFVGWADGDPW